jgi:ankyrin repeat protein
MFMQAATFGDIAALKLMMKCGFTTETRADDQSTALHCAARNGQAETVQYLLKNGASCGIKNEKRRLPVHEAILGSDTETAKILIEHTSGTLFSDEEEHTERSLAQTKNIEIFELYAYHRGTSFTASHAVEIFHGAIRAKNDTMIAALLSRSDIDVNSHNRRAWAPVHLAAGIGNAKAMDLFLASDRIDKSLTTRYSRMNALHVAASKGHTKVVKQLLDFNFDVHSLDRRQRTPLHLAVVVGMLETITLLLNEGKSDPLRQDRKGYTPLQCAVSKRHWEAVQLLLEYLDPITTCSPTHTESVKKDFTKKDLVSRLLCHVDFKDPNLVLPGWEGLTMLHQAAEKGDCEVMEVLLAHEKIDVNVGNWYLSTPLMAAAGFRQIEAVRLLLRHPEIDVNQKNKPGSTALYYAKDYRHQEIVDLLLSHGAIDDEDINEAKTVTQTSNTSMTENNSHMHSIPLQSEHQNDPELNLDDFMEDIMDWDDLSDAENETSE